VRFVARWLFRENKKERRPRGRHKRATKDLFYGVLGWDANFRDTSVGAKFFDVFGFTE